MEYDFRWNDWNLEHATRHGVSVSEAELVVRRAKPPYPQRVGDGKYQVFGRGKGGRLVHVIFILDDDGEVYIIHARPVEKRNEQRRVRRREK